MERWRCPVTREEALAQFRDTARVRYRDPACPWTGTVTPNPKQGRCVEGTGAEGIWVRVVRDDSGRSSWFRADSLEPVT